MNKYLVLFIVLVFVVCVSSLVSAELVSKQVGYVEDCVNLSVTVERLYGRDAFNLSNCTESSPYFWDCACPSLNFSLSLEADDGIPINSLNRNIYSVSLNYTQASYSNYSAVYKFTDRGGWWNSSLSKYSFVALPACDERVVVYNASVVVSNVSVVVEHNITNVTYSNVTYFRDLVVEQAQNNTISKLEKVSGTKSIILWILAGLSLLLFLLNLRRR